MKKLTSLITTASLMMSRVYADVISPETTMSIIREHGMRRVRPSFLALKILSYGETFGIILAVICAILAIVFRKRKTARIALIISTILLLIGTLGLFLFGCYIKSGIPDYYLN